jgi:hypothetical protein
MSTFFSKNTGNATVDIVNIVKGGSNSASVPVPISSYFTPFPGSNFPADTTYSQPTPFGFLINGVDVANYYQANWVEYTSAGSYTASVPFGANQIKVICIGSGGGGGGGGGGEYNTPHNTFNSAPSVRWTAQGGSGGGGGGYSIGTHPITTNATINITVGSGGNYGNGGAGNSGNEGNSGNGGNTTSVTVPGVIQFSAGGGLGGHFGYGGENHNTPVPSYNTPGGYGNLAYGNIGNHGQFGPTGDDSGPAGNGGIISNNGSYPTISSNTYGVGGKGGTGGHGSGGGDDGHNGTEGYCRIYFLY